MGGSPWASFTVRNSVWAARRSGCWLVVACVPHQIVSVLDQNFKISSFGDYENVDWGSTIDLMNKSDAICFGVWIEAEQWTIQQLVAKLLTDVSKPLILDADWVKCIQRKTEELKDRKTRKQTTILTLNMQETEHVFGSHYPDNGSVKDFSWDNWVYTLLKWPTSKLFTPNGDIAQIPTNDCPEMANAGSWDVLTGLIGWFMAQKRTPVESILAAIQTRKAAAKYYLTKTGDVVAQPEDIIEHIRYVIWWLHPGKKTYAIWKEPI